jgi:hypothetical protein
VATRGVGVKVGVHVGMTRVGWGVGRALRCGGASVATRLQTMLPATIRLKIQNSLRRLRLEKRLIFSLSLQSA